MLEDSDYATGTDNSGNSFGGGRKSSLYRGLDSYAVVTAIHGIINDEDDGYSGMVSRVLLLVRRGIPTAFIITSFRLLIQIMFGTLNKYEFL